MFYVELARGLLCQPAHTRTQTIVTQTLVAIVAFSHALPQTTPLLTTHYNCKLWNETSQLWRQMGYHTECIAFDDQSALISKYCPSKPNLRIQYSDVSRLLAIYEKGGWYVDSDVVPTPRCKTLRHFNETTFGLESNFLSVKEAQWWKMLQKSIAMWAFFGTRKDNRLLKMACEISRLSTRRKNAQESLVDYIFHTSGPFQYSSLWSGPTLPVSVFGCGQRHSKSPPCHADSCWGCHSFRGSWRDMTS